MDVEKFMREVLRLWMKEQGIKGTVVVNKKEAALRTATSEDGKGK